jgi:Tfp pilus assembly protein PilZ
MAPQKPREPRVTVNHEFASAEDFVSQYVSNISTSGVFVRCDVDIAVGTHVNLNFTILSEEIETITGIGEVTRVQDSPSGIGVEFRSLSQSSMALIEKLVREQGS